MAYFSDSILLLYRDKKTRKSPRGKKTPKRVKKEQKKLLNREIEICTSITNKKEKAKPKKSPGKKSKDKKSPVAKTIIRKRVALASTPSKKSSTPQRPKRVKRQKVSDNKVQIKIEESLVKVEEESKNFSVPQKQTQELKKKPTPRSKLIKEESKGNETGKVSSPYEIKKMIESSILSEKMILESIQFPSGKNSLKVMQFVREISISSVKKIQTSIQRIKATEKKLKDLQKKQKDVLKKKGFAFEKQPSY